MLTGTDGAVLPFWSPDSRSIGFFAGGKLKRIDAAGGVAVTVCDAPGSGSLNNVTGGTWSTGGFIVFAASGSGLYRVPASGGASSVLTKLDGPRNHSLPWFLPDGKHFLFRVGSNLTGSSEVRIGSLDNTDVKTVLKDTSQAMYALGHLLYVTETTLMARPFDADRLTFSGDPFPVADDVATGTGGNSAFSVSSSGVLVYHLGSATTMSELVWIDRAGAQTGTVGQPGLYGNVALSPDGRRAMVSLFDGARRTRDLWSIDLPRGVPTRFTFDPAQDLSPV